MALVHEQNATAQLAMVQYDTDMHIVGPAPEGMSDVFPAWVHGELRSGLEIHFDVEVDGVWTYHGEPTDPWAMQDLGVIFTDLEGNNLLTSSVSWHRQHHQRDLV
jgi:uncharacterized protein YndB with AHSA1/START domain